MKRTIIKIDSDLCNGCGACVRGCHEGALQLIDGKAVLVSEFYCDGLGACIGDCPVGAIALEEREAVAYDEVATLKNLVPMGRHVLDAHLKHLFDHQEMELLNQATVWLNNERIAYTLPVATGTAFRGFAVASAGGGCPGKKNVSFSPATVAVVTNCAALSSSSELTHFPIQLHLINPEAPFFQGADLLLAADCTAFAVGGFHGDFLKGKKLAIACPKLDTNQEVYLHKLVTLIEKTGIKTLTVVIMEVPCCGGLTALVKKATEIAKRKITVRKIIISVKGETKIDTFM